jgi:hypothetical protein
MASPHTAGAVALLYSCDPSLIGNIDATFALLQNNADAAPAGNCGAPPGGQGNNTYGYGFLDVLSAGLATCPTDDNVHESLAGFSGYYTNAFGQKLSFPHIEVGNISTKIYILNTDPIIDSLLVFDFIDMNGKVVLNYYDQVHANSSKTYDLEKIGLPPGFQGTAICTGSPGSHLAGIASLFNSKTSSLLSYNGQLLPGSVIPTIFSSSFIPGVVRNWEGMSTEIWAQNVGDSDTTAAAMLFNSSAGDTFTYTPPSIPKGGVFVFRAKDIPEIGDNFSGWAVLQADQPILTLAENWDQFGGNASAYEGLPSTDYSYIATRQYKNVDHLSSQTQIANIGAQTASLSAYFYNFDGSPAITLTQQIPMFNEIELDLRNIPNIPSGFNGSLLLVSNQPIIAVTSLSGNSHSGKDRLAQFIPGIISPANVLKFPGLVKDTRVRKSTEFSFFNYASSSISVNVTFYNQDGIVVAQRTDLIPRNGIGRYSTENIPELGDTYQGFAYVESDPIIGLLIPGETLLMMKTTPYYLPIMFRK